MLIYGPADTERAKANMPPSRGYDKSTYREAFRLEYLNWICLCTETGARKVLKWYLVPTEARQEQGIYR